GLHAEGARRKLRGEGEIHVVRWPLADPSRAGGVGERVGCRSDLDAALPLVPRSVRADPGHMPVVVDVEDPILFSEYTCTKPVTAIGPSAGAHAFSTVNARSDRPLKKTSALAGEPIVMDSNNDVTVATAIRADRRIPIL